MTREELSERVKNRLFVSSMMKVTDGAWVAEHGRGGDMVQIGALIADKTDRDHEPRCLLPLEEADMTSVLQKEVDVIRRSLGDIPIGLNAAPGDEKSALAMARAFQLAGGDIYELNCHGSYRPLLERGLLKAMPLPENRPALNRWLGGLVRFSIPIVVKFRAQTEGVDFQELLPELENIPDLFGVHFNVRDERSGEPDIEFVRQIRPLTKGLLFCSGHVTEAHHVRGLLNAGADCIGIAQGLRDEPGTLTRLCQELS